MNNKEVQDLLYSSNISVVILDKYGEKVLNNFLDKSNQKLGEYKGLKVIKNDEINQFFNEEKNSLLCVIGDMEEMETEKIVKRIIDQKGYNIYFILKNCKNIKYDIGKSICNIENEEDIYYFLESVLYLQMYSSLVAIDESDLWCILGNLNLKIIKTNSRNWKKDLEKIKSKNLFVHFIIGKKERLRDTNLILEEIQKELNHPSMVYMVTEHKKIKDNEIEIEINIIYGEDKNGFERDERTSY